MRKGKAAVWEIHEKMYHVDFPDCGCIMRIRFRRSDGQPFLDVEVFQSVEELEISRPHG
jgi:hypothetical protein